MVDVQEEIPLQDQGTKMVSLFPESLRRELPQPRRQFVNVGKMERIASGLAGAGLAVYGLKRGSALGFGLAALGGSLVARGVTGHCDAYKALGINTANKESSCGC